MFGVGVGMLFTPVLVDRMQLTFPSGYAVANILRALTDPVLLRRSISKLGGGMIAGYGVGFASFKVAVLGAAGVSASTVGAGFIVGARIALPALVVALIGLASKPYLVEIGWLAAGEPYRKIGFIISLGTILGAAGLDIVLILIEAAKRFKTQTAAPADPDWKRVNMVRLLLWIAAWGTGLVIVGSQVLHQPVYFLVIAVALSFVFVLVNGISLGISDWNPISSAFVMGVFIMAALGLKDPIVGLMCSSIILISCSVGGDMQQDRSTGWRLGTNRVNQFRYQVIGIACGAVLTVVLAKVFMQAYPILQADQFSNPHIEGAQQWQSAMTYKFVGAIKGITMAQPHVLKAVWLGIGIGLTIEITRKLIKRTARYKAFVANSRAGRSIDFIIDAFILTSPYASSFGGFVELPTVLWWAGGGIVGSLFTMWASRRKPAPGEVALPSDMSTMSLVGGGLIAGDSLAALSIGVYGLLRTVL
jgi:hypothetical protein